MICIVTVFRSANYGSFLQAKMLGEALSKYGDVCYLDEGQREWLPKHVVRDCLTSIVVNFDFKKAYNNIAQRIKNYRNWHLFRKISIQELNKANDNIIVIGSDEIWNTTIGRNQFTFFWGKGLKGRIYSYAPSANMATYEQLQSFGAKEYLSNFKAISVRDIRSQQVISQLTEKPVCITLDPTLLFNSDFYLQNSNYKPLSYKYIAIYMFTTNRKDIYQDNISRFAKEQGLKLVSIGVRVNWCDEYLSLEEAGNNPFLYYLDAEYVITNTFHGTAFAINFETNFVSFARNNKIQGLLSEFKLTSRNACDLKYDEFKKLMLLPINHEKVNQIKANKQKESFSFIKAIFEKE